MKEETVKDWYFVLVTPNPEECYDNLTGGEIKSDRLGSNQKGVAISGKIAIVHGLGVALLEQRQGLCTSLTGNP